MGAQGGSVGIRRTMTDRGPPLCGNPLQHSHRKDNTSDNDDDDDGDDGPVQQSS